LSLDNTGRCRHAALPEDGCAVPAPPPCRSSCEEPALPVEPGPADRERSAQQRAEQQAADMYATDAASQGLGITVTDVAPGRATATMRVTPAMVNGHGICHGGYLFLLADSAFAFACNTHGPPTVAAGADVTFLAPVREGEVVVAEAVERALRGRSGLYDVTVRRGGEPVLEFRGRSRSLPVRPASSV
jgi:acyl-CoA thioesterase